MLVKGTKLGPYEIISNIGAGGMGEVYQAHDTRLGRHVAIKILPSNFSDDPKLKQRLEREARAISNLSHPNICAIYDIGYQNGMDYLVMEYLDGETLAHRLNRGALTLKDALKYGIQLAEALQTAHTQGIVHRDLKPSNVMLTKSGAKLLDFGLAKYKSGESDTTVSSQIETCERPLTEEGIILGTLQYMAPEQLEGKEADHRTDVFALGEILYEMITGHRTFRGSTKGEIITAILSSEPIVPSSVHTSIPTSLDHVVRMCLAKDPHERWQSTKDVAIELKWISETAGTQDSTAHLRKATALRLSWLFTLLISILSFFLMYRYYKASQTAKIANGTHLSFSLPPNYTLLGAGTFAISPDGRRIAAAVQSKDGVITLAIRSLDSPTWNYLPGTSDASLPFWSPDGRYIAFFAQGKLKKIDPTGGPAQNLSDAPNGRGGTWSKNDMILFAPDISTGLFRITVNGSKPDPVTKLNSPEENSHRLPSFLPDGNHFLYTITSGNPTLRGVYMGSLKSDVKERILADHTRAEYSIPGYIMFVRNGNLVAVPFDDKNFQISGQPITLAMDIDRDPAPAFSSFSASENQTVVYSYSGITSSLIWMDRSGKQIGSLGKPDRYFSPALAPDGSQIFSAIPDPEIGTWDLWIAELQRGTFSRVTSDQSNDTNAVWSPNGKKIVFCSNRKGVFDLYQKEIGSIQEDELLLHTENPKTPEDWSLDGKYLLYQDISPITGSDLWILPMLEKHKPYPVVHTQFNEMFSQFSPDGKWIAYTSDETGRPEVYIQSFPVATTSKRQISTAGGGEPIWRHDQKELFYLSADRKMVSVLMNDQIEPELPSVLFQTSLSPPTVSSAVGRQYAVSADGQRFLLGRTITRPASFHIVMNWTKLLKY